MEQLTGADIRRWREYQKLSLTEFWQPLGISRQMGSKYELEQTPMAERYQRMICLHYEVTPTEIKETIT